MGRAGHVQSIRFLLIRRQSSGASGDGSLLPTGHWVDGCGALVDVQWDQSGDGRAFQDARLPWIQFSCTNRYLHGAGLCPAQVPLTSTQSQYCGSYPGLLQSVELQWKMSPMKRLLVCLLILPVALVAKDKRVYFTAKVASAQTTGARWLVRVDVQGGETRTTPTITEISGTGHDNGLGNTSIEATAITYGGETITTPKTVTPIYANVQNTQVAIVNAFGHFYVIRDSVGYVDGAWIGNIFAGLHHGCRFIPGTDVSYALDEHSYARLWVIDSYGKKCKVDIASQGATR